MHETGLVRAYMLGQMGQEGDDVMFGDGLDLINAGHVKCHILGLPHGFGVFARDHTQVGHRVACMGLDLMRATLRAKAIAVCNEKIAKKGETVGLSFYAFFASRNDDPELLMEAAEWWIGTHALDHFEKAVKIREMISSGV